MTDDLAIDVKKIDQFIAQYDEKRDGEIMAAYRRWASSPERSVLRGQGFVAYPVRYAKKFRNVAVLCFALFASFVLFVGASHAQTPEPTPTTVTISREAAVKCLENADKLAAIEAESAAKDKAIADLKAMIADLKIEFARVSGEKTQLETTLVRYNALIDILIKSARPKKIGLINF